MDYLENISITINDVTKEYTNHTGIKHINTIFQAGVLNIIVGENGSGKSTLLKCMMGLVSYKGTIKKKKYLIGYAPEDYVLPAHMTVKEFLISIGRIKYSNRYELNQRVKDYIEYFGLTNYLNKPISKLSNGMRQKVNLIQAIIHDPKIIILDEPLAALDEAMRPKVIKLVKELAKEKLIIITTHHPKRFIGKKVMYQFTNGLLEHV